MSVLHKYAACDLCIGWKIPLSLAPMGMGSGGSDVDNGLSGVHIKLGIECTLETDIIKRQ
jgi:hypothetical protein